MAERYPKSVHLNKEQNDFFEIKDINFSKWVRRKVDEAIKEMR